METTTLEFINQTFPNEASLVAIEPIMQKLRNKIRQVDAEILAAVRQQSSSGTRAKEDLAAAMQAIQELMQRIKEIKGKAEQSEAMVQEICRDIKKLDFAKKHITTTITALHRLAMLVSAIDQLQTMAAKRLYKEAAGQLEAVNQLCGHFEAYRDIPKINELREKFKNIKQMLKSHVFSDFSSLGTARLKEDGNLMQQLADACLVVDALDASVREELISIVCNKELTAYRQIFEGTELARLDKVERRYAWIKRQMRTNEEIWKIFPSSWRVLYLLCIQLCKATRVQLIETLNELKEKPDVATLLQTLKSTTDFEKDLATTFGEENESAVGRGVDSEDEADDAQHDVEDEKSASAIRKKYEKQLAAKSGKNELEDTNNKVPASHPIQLSFYGIISSCFEPHMSAYVELEEKTLMESVDKLVQTESWEAEEGSQTNILSSSTQVFLIIKKSLKRCSALTRNQTLYNLFLVFQRILKAYAAKLLSRLPRGGTGIVAAATGTDGLIKTSDKDERVICYIVNTAEYCHETAGQLAENISKMIDPQFADKIDMSEVQDEFSVVITRALATLVQGLETKLEAELAAMARMAWATMESVGDQSEYVNGISAVLSSSVPAISALLSPVYYQFFLDKLAASFAPRFHANIYKCKRISETGAQQMLLDTHAVKTLLLEVPSLGGQNAASASYNKFVGREMGKAEALLKVILSPVESIADTYRTLLLEGTTADFQRLLDLKGLKKAEQQPLLDYYNRRGPSGVGSSNPLATVAPAPIVTLAPASPPAPVTPTAATMASRDAVMARAAALGRGAMAQSAAAAAAVSSTGLKRIFALAESAKEGASKKEGTFRKLFNT
ncbi:hypothetical protein KP509_34G024900 [Ceratopteris richardii]|uniref:Vps53 N-terminal domain-containing protein n=2 Tax=Ceratopteris richardii TaxID=49495 RepID=A0A8T2QJI8_CERRI|nr:hypothetical protein KP509_34G024900 [Ceratopteris richardii]KAH7283808.1 hypothetical protein KP509_34G024900 [Ceratopteris richardii]KAH7283809.1 hypothetical protein KP509_34G024900 [Ceratopteris richardii]KAH7283810.1 hypothetical protein KP509_34G024900 [Ceratopteris richardii]KAH7283811.1 hypothetical protein KP509_34G024900 [Ceratopteris richardii]